MSIIFLSITTSSNVCAISIFNEDSIIDTIISKDEKTHSEKLLPLMKTIMDKNNIMFEDLNFIAIDVGPGSFTGIRIGLATVKAISEAHNIPIVPITSLKALSFNMDCAQHTAISLIDARNNQVYCHVYDQINNKDLYIADDIEKVLDYAYNYIKPGTTFVGDGSVIHKDLIKRKIGPSTIFSDYNSVSSESLGFAAIRAYRKGEYVTADNAMPFYLRKSQAERLKGKDNDKS